MNLEITLSYLIIYPSIILKLCKYLNINILVQGINQNLLGRVQETWDLNVDDEGFRLCFSIYKKYNNLKIYEKIQ